MKTKDEIIDFLVEDYNGERPREEFERMSNRELIQETFLSTGDYGVDIQGLFDIINAIYGTELSL